VNNLCKVIHKPYGQIPGPMLVNPVVGGNPIPGPLANDPGEHVSVVAENNMKLLTFYLLYFKRTSNTIVIGNMTLQRIQRIIVPRDAEANHVDADTPTINNKDWPRTMEAIEECLANCLGTTKIPLAYDIRKDLEPRVAPVDIWATIHQELITRAPIVMNANAAPLIYLQVFCADNKAVWLKLTTMTREQLCWTYICTYQKTCDGQKAY
jgi:hypothetical protein